MANTVFWIGLMIGMANKYEDIRTEMSFDDARDNFFVQQEQVLILSLHG